MDNFDFKKYVNNNPLLKEDFPKEYAKAFATATGNEEEIDVDLDGVAEYNYDIYVPPHVRGKDLVVRADSQNYRLPVEFLVDMAEQFGDMGNDAISFVDETVARFVQVGIAESEKDKLYNWFDNIMYAEGTMSDPDYDDGKDDDYYDMVSDIGENKKTIKEFNFKKYIKNNPLLK